MASDTKTVTVRWIEHHVYQTDFNVPADLPDAELEEYLDENEAWSEDYSGALREITVREII
jgi:hypothetical protein